MSQFEILPMKRHELVYDKLMVPIMLALQGFIREPLQETHPWHVQPIDYIQLDEELMVSAPPSARSLKKHYGFLFHAPILGGWKDYTVYNVADDQTPFHIGWVSRDAQSGSVKQSAVHRLEILDTRIKMLDGPPTTVVSMFALNHAGIQIPLNLSDSGRVGDKTHTDIRLF